MKLKLVLILSLCFFINNSFAQDSEMDKGLMAFDKKDFKTALVKLEPYAKQGDCLAQYAVGFSYLYGEGIKNDSLARYWLQLSAEQKQPRAMGPLSVTYFGAATEDSNVKAYLWAMLAAEYDPIQKVTATRLVIKQYLKPGELERANKLIDQYKERWKNQKNCK